MPIPDLTDEEHAAIVAALRKLIAEDRFPLSPRLKPLKSALAKLDPQKGCTLSWWLIKGSITAPPQPTGPMVGSRRKPRTVRGAVD
jgi:hypothetical protein